MNNSKTVIEKYTPQTLNQNLYFVLFFVMHNVKEIYIYFQDGHFSGEPITFSSLVLVKVFSKLECFVFIGNGENLIELFVCFFIITTCLKF